MTFTWKFQTDGYSICSKVITLHSYSNDFREIFSRPSWEEFKLGFHTVNSLGGYRFFSSSQIPSPVFSENSPCLPKLSKTSVLKSLDLRYDHIEKQEKMSTWSILESFKLQQSRENDAVCVLVTQLCPTFYEPMTVAHQGTLSMEFSRQEYSSGLPVPSPNRTILATYIFTFHQIPDFIPFDKFPRFFSVSHCFLSSCNRKITRPQFLFS